uniref:66 kDa stress protein-like n=1 Tax=Rhizophora mucronata TaxID=61149 RepID=A0A2P2J6L4_RHIMU
MPVKFTHIGPRIPHESTNKRFALAVTGGDNPQTIGRPLEIVDPASQDLEFLLEDVIVVGPPDPDSAGDVGRGDPLAVMREAGDGGLVAVFAVDGNVKRVVEVEDENRAMASVEDGVGLGVAGDQDPPATLRQGHARIGFRQL